MSVAQIKCVFESSCLALLTTILLSQISWISPPVLESLGGLQGSESGRGHDSHQQLHSICWTALVCSQVAGTKLVD